MLFKDEHILNIYALIFVILLGNLIFSNEEQPLNTYMPISIILSNNSILVNETQL